MWDAPPVHAILGSPWPTLLNFLSRLILAQLSFELPKPNTLSVILIILYYLRELMLSNIKWLSKLEKSLFEKSIFFNFFITIGKWLENEGLWIEMTFSDHFLNPNSINISIIISSINSIQNNPYNNLNLKKT